MTTTGVPVDPHIWRRAAALVLLCGGLLLLVFSDGFHALLADVLGSAERLISRHAVLGAVSFAGLAAASAMFAAVSSAVFMPMAVVAWGIPVSLLLLLWMGWSAGLVERRVIFILGPGLAIAAVSVAALWLAKDRIWTAGITDVRATPGPENAGQG